MHKISQNVHTSTVLCNTYPSIRWPILTLTVTGSVYILTVSVRMCS